MVGWMNLFLWRQKTFEKLTFSALFSFMLTLVPFTPLTTIFLVACVISVNYALVTYSKNTRINHSSCVIDHSKQHEYRHWQNIGSNNVTQISNIDIYKRLFVNSSDWAYAHLKFNAPYVQWRILRPFGSYVECVTAEEIS